MPSCFIKPFRENFSPFGFRKVAAKSDAYAQIVILEKI